MNNFTVPRNQHQEKVNAYFESLSSYWKNIYAGGGVKGEIIRDRHSVILKWIDSLALAQGARALEIGCGAGFMAVALAERGFDVHAIDSTETMIEQARQHAVESGTMELISLNVGDVYSLAFEDGTFDLVIAVGVIPWLEQVELAIQEMARVTRPGGYVILTTANRTGLASLLDPRLNPALSPLKLRVKAALERAGLRCQAPGMIFHDCRFIDASLARANLIKTVGITHGFGFSFLHRTVLPEALGTALHYRLQALANRNVPGFRSLGMAYFVLARKSPSQPLAQSTSIEKFPSSATRALYPENVTVH